MSTQTARGLAAGQTDEERIAALSAAAIRISSSATSRCSRACACRTCAPAPPSRWSSARWKCCARQQADARAQARGIRRAWRAPTTRSPSASIASRAACCARANARRGARRARSQPARRLRRLPLGAAAHRARRSLAHRRAASRSCASVPADDANMQPFEALLATGKPRCGQVRDTQRDFLFGPESREHRLGGAGAAGRERLARPARAGQRRARALPSGHEHGVPGAHGRADHATRSARRDGLTAPRPRHDSRGARVGGALPGAPGHRAAPLAAHRANYARDLARAGGFLRRAASATGRSSTASTCACSRRARTPAGLARAASSAACRRCAASSTTCCASGVRGQQPGAWTSARPRRRGACPARSMSTRSASCSTFPRDDALGGARPAIMELFYSSGLRLAELVGLDLGRPRSRRPHGARARQGPKTRIVPVGRKAVEALRAWLRERAALARRRRDGAVRRPQRPAPRSAAPCSCASRYWARRKGLPEPRAPAPVPPFLRHASA